MPASMTAYDRMRDHLLQNRKKATDQLFENDINLWQKGEKKHILNYRESYSSVYSHTNTNTEEWFQY